MHINGSFFGLACRTAGFSFLIAGAATLMHAQAPSAGPAPKTQFFLASSAAPDFTGAGDAAYSSSSSSSADAFVDEHFDMKMGNPDSKQPPPRRRYGRPNYSDSHTNPDGSNKWGFMAGGGVGLPTGNTHKYQTESYAFQFGVGRNFSKAAGVMMQFDYDHFGLQGSTLANQQFLYNYGCTPAQQSLGNCSLITDLDGNNHVWSLTLNPTFTVPTDGPLGAYAVVGAGYYHKVTNFTIPTVGTYCDYFYGCYQYQANR